MTVFIRIISILVNAIVTKILNSFSRIILSSRVKQINLAWEWQQTFILIVLTPYKGLFLSSNELNGKVGSKII